MAYRTDGSSHKNGVQQEKDLVERMNNDRSFASQICPSVGSETYVANQKGGTKYKEDIEVVLRNKTVKISVKHKKNIKVGSFDWVNTSLAVKESSCFDEIKKVSKEISKTKPSVSAARKRFNEVSNKVMKGMASNDIRKILIGWVSMPNKDKRMIVTDKTSKRIYAYDFVDDPMDYAIHNMTPKFKWGRGRTSAKIVFEDDQGQIYDYGLRGRLVSNNGISAMAGKGKANKSSIPVFKIQQDKVTNIIERIPETKLTII